MATPAQPVVRLQRISSAAGVIARASAIVSNKTRMVSGHFEKQSCNRRQYFKEQKFKKKAQLQIKLPALITRHKPNKKPSIIVIDSTSSSDGESEHLDDDSDDPTWAPSANKSRKTFPQKPATWEPTPRRIPAEIRSNYQHDKDKARVAKARENPEFEEMIELAVNRLSQFPHSDSTQRQHAIHHRYFDALMKRLKLKPIPTVNTVLRLIADMDINQYSSRYIGCAVSAMKTHRKLNMDGDELTTSRAIKDALANVRKGRPVKEDTRLPISPDMVREMSDIADRDFSSIMALTFKALLWTGITAMLRGGEMTNNTQDGTNIKRENISVSRKGITIPFHGWKNKLHRRTLLFPFLPGTAEEAHSVLKDYIKIRPRLSDHEERALFVDDKGRPFNRFTFTPFFHHLVDHCSYKDLNVTCHSIRIGGATAWHAEGKDVREIMCLGRWTDLTVNTYLRPELLEPPEELMKNPDYHSKRALKKHIFCDRQCALANKAQSQSKQQPRRKDAFDNNVIDSLYDTHKAKVLDRRTRRAVEKDVRASVEVPFRLKNLRTLLKAKVNAVPYVTPYNSSTKHIKKYYDGDARWFTTTVYLARQRWKAFLETVKYSYYQRKKSGPATDTPRYTASLATMQKETVTVSNVQFIREEDKAAARDLLNEYDEYAKNMTPELKTQWRSITPACRPWKWIPNHIMPSPREVAAERLYAAGNVAQAKRLMDEVRSGPSQPQIKKELN